MIPWFTLALIIAVVLAHTMADGACDPGQKLLNDFEWSDYTVVVSMLSISCGIGVFYGFFSKNQATSDDFLLGGSSMKTAPMALSLATNFITAIELLGNPAEMYNYGAQFWLICVSFLLVVPITSKLYLPVYMKLRLTSCFEFLELRFSTPVRTLASALYILQMIFYTSVAVYAPALALSHVTGLNVYIAVTLVYLVCIFYSSQGGMKAVIITDTFQSAVLVGSLLLILGYGGVEIGDLKKIWMQSYNTDRLNIFNLNPSLMERHTVWSVVIGGTFYWTTLFCANQASIQKYLSVSQISQVRIALWVSCGGLIFVYTVNFLTGMLMVEHYKTCDPMGNHVISASDQLLALYVSNVMGHVKGVAGFFVAGIFAASLGTVASALTSIAAAICQDFMVKQFNMKLQDAKGAMAVKWISLIAGLMSFAIIFVVEQLGSVMQVALSFNGMVGGVTLGLFSLGMFFPWANAKGALTGAIISFLFVATIGIGAQIDVYNGESHEPLKPTSIKGCLCYNETFEKYIKETPISEEFSIFRISYLWYSAIGCIGTVSIGLLVSMFTNFTKPYTVSNDLLSPAFVNLYNSLPMHLKKKLYLVNENVDENIISKENKMQHANNKANGNVTMNMEVKENIEELHM